MFAEIYIKGNKFANQQTLVTREQGIQRGINTFENCSFSGDAKHINQLSFLSSARREREASRRKYTEYHFVMYLLLLWSQRICSHVFYIITNEIYPCPCRLETSNCDVNVCGKLMLRSAGTKYFLIDILKSSSLMSLLGN